jgi:hypothetical protein
MAVWVDTVGTVTVLLNTGGWHPLSIAGQAYMHTANTSLHSVRAVDVGQGDCNAIIGARRNGGGAVTGTRIITYFDMGGGCGRCARTNPDYGNVANMAARFDFTVNPSIILSHWDKDHYYGAVNAPTSHGMNWLAPRQRIGVQCARFVNRLTNIQCYPAAGNAHRYQIANQGGTPHGGNGHIYVEQATGNANDRNLNGLCVTAITRDALDTADVGKIVMPGDAPYQDIPSLAAPPGGAPGGALAALFAYHHGSRTHFTLATRAAIPAAPTVNTPLAFSYGLTAGNANGFGHPHATAVAHYRTGNGVGAGWNARSNTASVQPNTTANATLGHNAATRGSRDFDF